jgi:hypothetical protein
MSAFPAPDTRDGEVLAARPVPRDHWRHDHTWVRFYLQFCQKYRHPPTDSKSLQVFLGTLASKGHTAAQRAQAHCAVDDDAVLLSPELRSWRDDAAGAPTVPNDGDDGLAPRTRDGGIGQSAMMEAHAPAPAQANGARDQTHAAWREVEAKLTDEILLRHDSPKTLQA